MNDQMNKGMRSICLTVFAFAMTVGISRIVSEDLQTYAITDNLLILILMTLTIWILFSNIFDAIDGVTGFVRQHIVKKPVCTGTTVEE